MYFSFANSVRRGKSCTEITQSLISSTTCCFARKFLAWLRSLKTRCVAREIRRIKKDQSVKEKELNLTTTVVRFNPSFFIDWSFFNATNSVIPWTTLRRLIIRWGIQKTCTSYRLEEELNMLSTLRHNDSHIFDIHLLVFFSEIIVA